MIIEINFCGLGLRLGLGIRIDNWGIGVWDFSLGLGIEIGNCGKLLFNMTKVEYVQRGTRLNYYHVTAKLNWLF